MNGLSNLLKQLAKLILPLILADLSPKQVFVALFSQGVDNLTVLGGGQALSEFAIPPEFVSQDFFHHSQTPLGPILIIYDSSYDIVHFGKGGSFLHPTTNSRV